MASISKDAKGNRTIQFVAGDRKRRSIRLGKMNAKAAATVKTKVEALNAAAISQTSWDRETADWVGSLDSALYDKLARAQLLPLRSVTDETALAPFLDGYINGRSDVKASTLEVYNHAKSLMVGFFGVDRQISDISPADADDWRRWLSKKGLAINTVRRRCGIARQFLRAAVRKRLIQENPFSEMKDIAVKSNRSRDYFVSREEAAKIIDACPDSQWRLIFALSRFGGLRCPSEHLALQWNEVDWAANRMIVRSPKTAHHDGGESRVVPVFSELRPFLEAVFEEAEPGTVHVITRYRESNVNLRTQLERIIAKASLTPWPKLFANLRASRATELAAKFPAHVAAEWLGHSMLVAQKHYWQVTDADFELAASGQKGALHNPVQHTAATTSTDAPRQSADSGSAEECSEVRCGATQTAGPLGLEPRIMESESIVLPITPRAKGRRATATR